jgi:hypothetical protein
MNQHRGRARRASPPAARWRKRRDDEKFRAAAAFVIVATLYMTGTLLWATYEFAFHGFDKLPHGGRCWLIKTSSAGFGGYYMQLVLFILSFGSSLVAKRLDAIKSWLLLVYGSAAGIALGLYILTCVQAESDTLYRLTTLGCDVAIDNDAEGFIASHVKVLIVTVIVWYCGIIATQFGLELPKRADSAASGGRATE